MPSSSSCCETNASSNLAIRSGLRSGLSSPRWSGRGPLGPLGRGAASKASKGFESLPVGWKTWCNHEIWSLTWFNMVLRSWNGRMCGYIRQYRPFNIDNKTSFPFATLVKGTESIWIYESMNQETSHGAVWYVFAKLQAWDPWTSRLKAVHGSRRKSHGFSTSMMLFYWKVNILKKCNLGVLYPSPVNKSLWMFGSMAGF